MTLKEFFVKASLKYDKAKFEKFDQQIMVISGNLRGMATQVSAAAAAVFGLTKMTASNSREMSIQSEALGMNVERLQELAYSAKIGADVNRNELYGSLQSISRVLYSVRMGTLSAADASAQLQIDQGILADHTLRADQVLGFYAERIRGIQDPIRKSALAVELLGSSGDKMIPWLNLGVKGMGELADEGRRVGYVLGKDAVAAGVKFDQTLDRLLLTIKGISNVVGTDLMRVIGPVLVEFKKYVVENRKLIAIGVRQFIEMFIKFLKIAFKVLGFIIDRIKIFIEFLGGMEKAMDKIGIGLGLLFGAKMLHALGAFALAVWGITVPMALLAIKAIAIGAAIMALYLIIEDFIVFMQGGDSVIGKMFDAISDFSFIENVFLPLEQWFIKFFTETVPELAVEGFKKIPDLAKAWFGGAADLGAAVGTGLREGGSSLWEGIKTIGNDMAIGAGFKDAPPGYEAKGGGGGGAGGGLKKINVENINITTEQGASNSQVVKNIMDGVQGGIDPALRQARPTFTGGRSR